MTDARAIFFKVGILAATLTAGAALVHWTWRESPVSTVRWWPVERGPLEQRIGLVGRIVSGSSTTLSAPFEGLVQQKLFTDDQRVSQGQLLLTINPDVLHMQMRNALAERLKAESAVRALEDWANSDEMARARRAVSSAQSGAVDSRRKLTETRVLLEQGIVPRMEVDSLTLQLQTQMQDLLAAQAELEKVRKRGQGEHRQIADMELLNARARFDALKALETRGEIRAPFPGIIQRLPDTSSSGAVNTVEPGVRITQGQPLFSLASLERLQVQAKVDESDINQLREGMPVQISGDGFEGVLQGHVTSVGAQAIASEMHRDSASYHVSVVMPALETSTRSAFRLGMSARLSILVDSNPDAVVIPLDAIGEEGGKHFVIHRAAMDKPEARRFVSLGQTTVSGVHVSGLDDGFVRREVDMD
jgi:multidrug resistance efflux pump